MGRKKRTYDDDDGRTIAEMGDLSQPPLLIPDPAARPGADRRKDDANPPDLNREDRKWVILGTLKASLLIGAAYAIGLGIIIALICLLF